VTLMTANKMPKQILERTTDYHIPVMVDQVLEYLSLKPGKVYLDVTFGGGGHTRAILESQPDCRVIAFDWDPIAIDRGQAMVDEFEGRLQLILGNFALLYRIFKKQKLGKVDGILADFGTSHAQILSKDGFSFNRDTPLDMRMSPSFYRKTAGDVINTFTERELRDLFSRYGQETYAGRIARSVVEGRRKARIRSTTQLATLIERCVPKSKARKIHPATRVFQALRIYVNHEIENISIFLKQAADHLNVDGRIVCISFHSLEDRAVKQFFRSEDSLEVLTKKVVMALEQELSVNASARSARLRAAQKKGV